MHAVGPYHVYLIITHMCKTKVTRVTEYYGKKYALSTMKQSQTIMHAILSYRIQAECGGFCNKGDDF